MDKETSANEKSNSEPKENYYQILNCKDTASSSELKRNYQKLIKRYHPDKQEGSSSSEKFISIDKAYKTLIDDNLRKEYDSSLVKEVFDEHFLIHAEVLRTELNFGSDGFADYCCRCGENFRIDKNELNDDGYVIECFQCSNCVLIK